MARIIDCSDKTLAVDSGNNKQSIQLMVTVAQVELLHGKTNNLHRRKQRRRSASQELRS